MIQEYEVERVPLSQLQFDNENPNTLTKEQIEGIKKSFKKFGNVDPILIDQNNLIVHGNHRAEVYQELGMEEIPCYRRTFKDDNERRLCSQTMNKLHGEYDLLRDIDQLTKILEGNRLDELAELIAKPREQLINLLQQKDGDIFDQIISENKGIQYFTYQFHFEEKDRDFVDSHLAELKNKDKLASNGDIFLRLCEIYDATKTDKPLLRE